MFTRLKSLFYKYKLRYIQKRCKHTYQFIRIRSGCSEYKCPKCGKRFRHYI